MSINLTNILVATDGSPSSLAAERRGIELASTMGGRVTFLHVVRPDHWVTTRSGSAPRTVRTRARGDRVLAEAVERAGARNVPATGERIEGEEVRTILAEADAIDADVVVLGRGRRRPKVRSVAKSVVRRSGRTVFVARAA